MSLLWESVSANVQWQAVFCLLGLSEEVERDRAQQRAVAGALLAGVGDNDGPKKKKTAKCSTPKRSKHDKPEPDGSNDKSTPESSAKRGGADLSTPTPKRRKSPKVPKGSLETPEKNKTLPKRVEKCRPAEFIKQQEIETVLQKPGPKRRKRLQEGLQTKEQLEEEDDLQPDGKEDSVG